jgi:hypothetical protein
MLRLPQDHPLAVAALAAIRQGDLDGLRELLRTHSGVSTAMLVRPAGSHGPEFAYPLISAAVDWPGHFPRASETIGALVAAGADVNARCVGQHSETPLHWAASCDDVEALDALLDAEAELEAPGAVIAGGTALDDAVAFAQWRAAQRLVERGAQTAVWHAAALGLMDRLERQLAEAEPAALYPWGKCRPADAVHVAFWCACHGVQRGAAEYLLSRGAALDWVSPWDGLTPLDAAVRSQGADLVQWLRELGARSARG